MEKNRLLKEFENEEDLVLKSSLFNLLEVVRKRLRSLRKGEAKRKQRWKNKQAHKLFLKNPYIAGKNVLDPQCTAKLIVDEDSLDNHKSSTLLDPLCNVPLPSLECLPPHPSIYSPFVTQKLTFSEFKKIVNSRRNGSAPGINKIPYKVYKKCPNICSYLFRLFKSCIKNCVVPLQWRMASEVYIPKNKNPDSTNINDFRPISLLNVEGKLFFSLVSKRIENHIFRNYIIDKSVQKGCMERVTGCWEHMSVVWNELKSSKKENLDLSAIWLDIANAYGSVPHQLIFFALRRYGVPENTISLIEKYYSGLWSASLSDSAPSSWHLHQFYFYLQ